MCNIAQMVNVLQSVLVTDGPEGPRSVRTTTYYAYLLFKGHRAKTALKVETDGPKPADFNPAPGQPEPPPDLSLSASRQGAEMVVSLVNPRPDASMDVECALRGASARRGTAQILHDSDRNAANGFDHPDRVTIQPHQVAVDGAGATFRITLPALSVATVNLELS
jgi:alpha-N-arabinofuranosidase